MRATIPSSFLSSSSPSPERWSAGILPARAGGTPALHRSVIARVDWRREAIIDIDLMFPRPRNAIREHDHAARLAPRRRGRRRLREGRKGRKGPKATL